MTRTPAQSSRNLARVKRFWTEQLSLSDKFYYATVGLTYPAIALIVALPRYDWWIAGVTVAMALTIQAAHVVVVLRQR